MQRRRENPLAIYFLPLCPVFLCSLCAPYATSTEFLPALMCHFSLIRRKGPHLLVSLSITLAKVTFLDDSRILARSVV